MKSRNDYIAIPYVLSMVFAFNNIYGDYQYSVLIQNVIAFVWVMYGLMTYIRCSFKSAKSKECVRFIKTYVSCDIIIHIYSIGLIVCGVVDARYLTTNISAYVPTLIALVSLYLFKEKSILYNCASVCISWLVSIIVSVAQHGISIFKNAIIQGYINSRYSIGGVRVLNHFELHDVVLAVWYFIVYFIYSKESFSKRQKKYLFLFIVIGLMGLKRSALLGVIAAVLFHIVVKGLSEYKQKIICKLVGYCLCGGSILYVYLIYGNGWFFKWADSTKIDFMGRLWIYKQLVPYVSFDPFFWGLGRNVIANWFSEKTGYLLHSDILKMFAENGVYIFVFWLWYIFIHIPKIYQKRFGSNSLVIYTGLIIYTFFLYMTDNSENYFACKTLSIMIPAYHALYYDSFKNVINMWGSGFNRNKYAIE